MASGRRRASDRHRLLGADHGDGDDRDAGAHGDLDEPAPAEAAELVALAVGLAGPFDALGEHQHELVLVAQQPVGVVGVGGEPAEAGPQRADDRQRPEEVVGEAVDRSFELGLDAVHDHRCVRGDGAGVVGDEQRPAVGGIFSRPSHSARNQCR